MVINKNKEKLYMNKMKLKKIKTQATTIICNRRILMRIATEWKFQIIYVHISQI